jgi:hypothetical protein
MAWAGVGQVVLRESNAQVAAGMIGSVAATVAVSLRTVVHRACMVALVPGEPLTRQYGVMVWGPAGRAITAVTARPSALSWWSARFAGP